MFTKAQFEHLQSLWDGVSATPEVCVSCKGLCCNNIEKTLIPGEYEYVKGTLNYENSLWVSKGCLCHSVPYKPVICKTFPLDIKADITGYRIMPELSDAYTTNCKAITFNQEVLKDYLDYLFSDIDNRIFWAFTFSVPFVKDNLKKAFLGHGHKISDQEAELRAVYKLTKVPYDDKDGLFEYSYCEEEN